MVKTIPVADPALLPLSSMPETSYHQRHIEASFYHTSVFFTIVAGAPSWFSIVSLSGFLVVSELLDSCTIAGSLWLKIDWQRFMLS